MKKIIWSSILYILIGILTYSQLTVMNVLAESPNNPITSAITAAINSVTNQSPQPTQPPVTAPIPNAPAISSPIIMTPVIPEVTMHPNDPALSIRYPVNIQSPTLNFASSLISTNTATSVIVQNHISIDRPSNLGNLTVRMPDQLMISGPAGWNGIINMPTILNISTVTPGTDMTTMAVIEIGANDTFLTLDKAVRIVIPGQANRLVGYQTGSVFININQICDDDSQAVADNLPGGGNCYINSKSDLVIWTKHFTKFVTYMQTAHVSSGSNAALAPVDPQYNSQAPVCEDSKPASAPKLTSVISAEPNTVTLTWTGASNPVTYYLIAYGEKSNLLQYGNPNVGDKNARSYKVRGLSGGQTYYFKIRAGNNCMPGEFSNEIKANVIGPETNSKIADNFNASVLSNTKDNSPSDLNLPFKPITSANPARFVTASIGLFAQILDFIKNLLHLK